MDLFNARPIKAFVVAVALCAGTSANAGIISGNLETGLGKSVALQGLEWLTLDESYGLSYQDVADGFTSVVTGTSYDESYWRFATSEETITLLDSIYGGVTGYDQANFDGASWFIDTFVGVSYSSDFERAVFKFGGIIRGTAPYERSDIAEISFDLNDPYSGDRGYFDAPFDSSTFRSGLETRFITDSGSLLVRKATIPEPSIIALMGLGIFGLGLSRRKMK